MPGCKSWRKKLEHLRNFLNFRHFQFFCQFLASFGYTVCVDLEVSICSVVCINVYQCCMNAKNDNGSQYNYILVALHTALVDLYWRNLPIFAIFAYLTPQLWSKMGPSRQDESGPKLFPLYSGHHEQLISRLL